jgi:hypothetical protein
MSNGPTTASGLAAGRETRDVWGMRLASLALAALAWTACNSSSSSSSSTATATATATPTPTSAGPHAIKTIFVILMENNNWSDIYRSAAAPYINSLLPKASWCTKYFDNPHAIHPSEPNYIWLEAGDNLGCTNDLDPCAANVSSANHVTKLMDAAGVSWKTYAEGAPPGVCPIASTGDYAPKHVPVLFFSDVVGTPPSATSAACIQHVVPLTRLGADLSAGTFARYNFIVPDLCNDMHGARDCPDTDEITQGDTWLGKTVPMILQSGAYKDGGALFITWDESEGGEHPIGMIALSPLAKGGGYQSTTRYFHSSFVRTVEEVFGLSPLLNDAARQPDLSDLFASFP